MKRFCTPEYDVPGCDTGPAGRLGFVIREVRVAWRNRRNEKHSRTQKHRRSEEEGTR